MATLTVHEDVPDETRMSFWEHIEELRRRLKIVIVVLLVLWVVFMTFSVSSVGVGSYRIPILLPAFAADSVPVANQFFLQVVDYLKPSYVNLSSAHP